MACLRLFTPTLGRCANHLRHETMKFTIVTPSFNQGQYIRETIESVLSQKGPFSIEYFVVDGGSKDQTLDVLRAYEEKLKQGGYPIQCEGIDFSWWIQSGRGQSQAINEGFLKTSGDILAWINSDDFYEAGAFARVQAAYESNPEADLFCGDCRYLDEIRGTKDIRRAQPVTLESVTERALRISQPAAFFTTRITSHVGLMDENLHYVMDYDLWVRILRNGAGVVIPHTLATFRIWGASKTTTAKEKFKREWREVHKKYGLPVIDPKKIHHISDNVLFNYLKKRTPRLYDLIKQSFYKISSNIRY